LEKDQWRCWAEIYEVIWDTPILRKKDMRKLYSITRQALLFAVMLFSAQVATAKDWPQWHGPNRDNISTETGLMKQWPEEGPQMLWSIEGMGTGYSTVSIADGFIYVTGISHMPKNGTSRFPVQEARRRSMTVVHT
jgi:hypothetical protein